MRVAIVGYGRMGREVEAVLRERGHVAVVAARDAFELAARRNDSRRAARSAVIALHAMHRDRGVLVERVPEFRDWALRADGHAGPRR